MAGGAARVGAGVPEAAEELTAVSVFSGVGGLDLGAEFGGVRVVAMSEAVTYRRPVLCVSCHGSAFILSVRQRFVLLENGPGLLSSCSCRGCRKCGALLRWHRERGCPGAPGGDGADAGDGSGEYGEWLDRGGCRACAKAREIRKRHAGTDFAVVCAALANLGYRVSYRVLDSRYFGVAQRRRRVFMFAELDFGAGGRPEVLLVPESGGPGLDDKARRRAADGGWWRWYVRGQRAGDETAPTLTKGGHNDGVSYPGRRKEDDENLVVVGEGSRSQPGSDLGVQSDDAAGDTHNAALSDADEPQTFDWQLSGRGGDKSFRGKGRSWIEDKPGTARSLSTTKTLAVYDPAKARATAFQQTPQGDLMEDDVAPPVLARGGSVGNNTPMVATGVDTQNQLETGDVGPTLRTLRPGSSTGQDDSVPAVVLEQSIGFTPGMGANAGTIGAESETAPTLKSAESGNTRTPAVFTKLHGAQDTEDHETWDEADVARTQNGLQHATELVVQPTEEALAFYPTEGQEAGRTWDEEAPTIKIGSGNGDGKASGNPPAVLRHPGAAVRRLTPRECERLQGFLDDWTD